MNECIGKQMHPSEQKHEIGLFRGCSREQPFIVLVARCSIAIPHDRVRGDSSVAGARGHAGMQVVAEERDDVDRQPTIAYCIDHSLKVLPLPDAIPGARRAGRKSDARSKRSATRAPTASA